MSKTYISDEEIIKLIDLNDWDTILKHLLNDKIEFPNRLLINGNGIMHMASIRGQTRFLEEVFSLCYSKDPTTTEESGKPLKESAKIACGVDPDRPNEDGMPPLHLYYKYGGTSKRLLNLYSVCHLDQEYTPLLPYLIGNIDLLEVYIDSTIKKNCLENIEYVSGDTKRKHNIYYLLIKQIKKTDDKKERDRYLDIISSLMRNLTNKKAVFYAIAMDSHDVFDHLNREELFDPMVRNSNRETPLIMATMIKNVEFVKKILDIYRYVSSRQIESDLPSIKDYIALYRSYSDGRPINTSIKAQTFDILEVLIDALIRYREANKDETYHTETDEYNSTYLHNYLMSNEPDSLETDLGEQKIVRYLIEYTDLNQENYYGYTSAHLIFLKGFWKIPSVKDALEGRKVDLLKIDPNGNNIYSYIPKKDNSEFMRLTETLKLLINTKGTSNTDNEIFDVERIIDVVSRSQLKNKKDYGLFHPTQMNYILFVLYLQKTHSNLFVPTRRFDQEKKDDQQYLMEMTSYPLSEIQDTFNEIQLMDHTRFYSYTPHMVSWYDSKMYLIHPELVDILKKQNEEDPKFNRRFVMIKLLIVLSENANHANCLIYDRKKREAWRFESYGLTDLVKDGEMMDMTLKGVLETAYGKIEYYSPSAYLQNIKFQLADNEDFQIAKNLGDPGGYCLAWCIWFIDVICSNLNGEEREPTVEYLMKNYITRERFEDILFEPRKRRTSTKKIGKSLNIYLEYIRQYGHHLDAEKNNILREIGVAKDTYYKFLVKTSEVSKIDNYLRINEVQYD